MATKVEAKTASLVKVKILVSMGGENNFRVGEITEVEQSLATQLINAGYAEKK